MSNVMFRKKMISALEATGADGASITGTESEVSITLTFKREVSNGCSDGSACCRSSVVAAEVDNAGCNMELPQGTDPSPTRRMWKRWAKVGKHGRILDTHEEQSFKAYGDVVVYETPITILPGHDAVKQIENDAFSQGYREGVEACTRKAKDPVFKGFEDIACVIHGDNTITMVEGDKVLIDGVEPVVVDGVIDNNGLLLLKSAEGITNTPCRVHLYPGVDSSGKKVQP